MYHGEQHELHPRVARSHDHWYENHASMTIGELCYEKLVKLIRNNICTSVKIELLRRVFGSGFHVKDPRCMEAVNHYICVVRMRIVSLRADGKAREGELDRAPPYRVS